MGLTPREKEDNSLPMVVVMETEVAGCDEIQETLRESDAEPEDIPENIDAPRQRVLLLVDEDGTVDVEDVEVL